ncbi:AAA family ATPase [Treponema sp. TIM-1]|uniref:AAA family ATPase n=1 Tax=Treponema sp. TIM-1 TaxID=2898417 RepID=UPI00397F93CA
MAIIEGFKIKNYRSLRNIEIGKMWNTRNEPLTPLTAVIGKNGVGKSSLFDAFGFLADCLRYGVEDACDMGGRGGIKKIRSLGVSEPIEISVYYRQDGNSRPITFELAIDSDQDGRPYVKSERLRQRRKGQDRGRPFSFLILENGEGYVWKGEANGIVEQEGTSIKNIPETSETEKIKLQDPRKLGLATLGALVQHPRISAFTQFIEGWYLSYFSPDAARSLPLAGPQRHLNKHGDNLGNVVQYLEREHKEKLNLILANISKKIPGIQVIKTERALDDRLLLCFNEKGFIDPFYAQQMSDGTLKLFSYLLLLFDPNPPPFICIEEPENGLYHKLLEIFAAELREHATGTKGGSGGTQIFLTTHQPYLIDAMKPEEVWILEKQDDGFSTISRASDNELIRNLVDEGLLLGSLWYSDYIDART